MYSLNKRFAPWCFSLVLVVPAQAAFNPAIVAGDAQWVVHVDMFALRGSTLGREIIATAQRKMPQPMPPSMGIQFDFEQMLATISSVTAYGSNLDPRTIVDGALVIEGTGEMRKVAEGWLAQATLNPASRITELSDLGFPGYALNKEVIIGFPPETIILIGKSKEQIVRARALFRGESLSLANSSSTPLAKLLATIGRAYAVAASVAPPAVGMAPGAPQARILQLVNSGMVTLGEQNQQTIARAELVAKSDDMAEKLLKILQGLTAMVSLTETNDRQLAEFLQAATVTKQDRTVTMQVAYSSDRIVQMIENAQQGAPKPPQRGGGPGQRGVPIDPKMYGTVIDQWKLNQAPADAPPSADTLKVHSIPNIHLATGSTITISALLTNGYALVDRIDIFPMEAGPGLRFEAEYMRTGGSAMPVLNLPFASGGRFARLAYPRAYAQLEFPGVEGDYILHIHYIDESAGTKGLAVSVRAPVTPAGTK